jgi:hypothetical protein
MYISVALCVRTCERLRLYVCARFRVCAWASMFGREPHVLLMRGRALAAVSTAKATGEAVAVQEGAWTHVRACRTCMLVLLRCAAGPCALPHVCLSASPTDRAGLCRQVRQLLTDAPQHSAFLLMYKVGGLPSLAHPLGHIGGTWCAIGPLITRAAGARRN